MKEVVNLLLQEWREKPENWEADQYRFRRKSKAVPSLSFWIANGLACMHIEEGIPSASISFFDRIPLWFGYKRWAGKEAVRMLMEERLKWKEDTP